MASVDKPKAYFKDADASFVVACVFTGNETPDSVTWTKGASTTLVNGQDGYTMALTNGNKMAALTKTSPALADTGDYKCLFVMATEVTYQPSATSAVTVVRESQLHFVVQSLVKLD